MNTQILGFVGLGKMGGRMSARLIAAGYPVVAFDVAGTGQRMPPGATAAASVEDVAARADIVLLSLPDGTASKMVCGQLAQAAPRTVRIVVDLSTIGIAAARDCAGSLEAVGMTYVDAPVSGGVAGARSGSLTAMVGAGVEVFETLRPLLDVLAKNCFRVGGEAGQGQAMKLLNNFISAAALAATSEGVVFGAKLGLDLGQMIDVINASSGRSAASIDKFPKSVIPRSYDFGFSGALMTKDAALYLENAEAAGVPHAMGLAVARLWQRYNEACPDTDFTFIHKYLEDMGQVV